MPFNATHTTEAELRGVELDRHDDRRRSSRTVIACPIARFRRNAIDRVGRRFYASSSSYAEYNKLDALWGSKDIDVASRRWVRR